MTLHARDTRVFVVNNSTGLDFSLDDNGDNWLWSVTAVYIVSFIAVTAGGILKPPAKEKVFPYLCGIALLAGAISYFTAASNLGWVGVPTVHMAAGIRQIYFSKYINWFVGWTPMVITLGIISGISWATIIYHICLLWVWIGSWLAGAMVPTVYRWAYFTFGSVIYFLLAISLLIHYGSAKSRGLGSQYLIICVWLVGVWLPYNIAWALDDGANQYVVARGWIFWGILDLATVPVTSCIILFFARTWDGDQYKHMAYTWIPEDKEVKRQRQEQEKLQDQASQHQARCSCPKDKTMSCETLPI